LNELNKLLYSLKSVETESNGVSTAALDTDFDGAAPLLSYALIFTGTSPPPPCPLMPGPPPDPPQEITASASAKVRINVVVFRNLARKIWGGGGHYDFACYVSFLLLHSPFTL
jgi:hypothetical protein